MPEIKRSETLDRLPAFESKHGVHDGAVECIHVYQLWHGPQLWVCKRCRRKVPAEAYVQALRESMR